MFLGGNCVTSYVYKSRALVQARCHFTICKILYVFFYNFICIHVYVKVVFRVTFYDFCKKNDENLNGGGFIFSCAQEAFRAGESVLEQFSKFH